MCILFKLLSYCIFFLRDAGYNDIRFFKIILCIDTIGTIKKKTYQYQIHHSIRPLLHFLIQHSYLCNLTKIKRTDIKLKQKNFAQSKNELITFFNNCIQPYHI